MNGRNSKQYSEAVTVFQERRLPEKATPVGYAALIGTWELAVPLPLKLAAIGARHKVYEENGWHLYTPRHMPDASLEGHLIFALKYEGLDLAVLKRLFVATPQKDIEDIIRAKPTSSYARRIWFLYEWLLEEVLDLVDARTGTYANVVDVKQQWAIEGKTSSRHRVRNNLPGTREFCPMVFRSEVIEHYVEENLAAQAQEVVGTISADILARTAAFLLLKDSKSSYTIEGEAPPQTRIQRWGRAIGGAGKQPLDTDELLRLQTIVIGKGKFIKLGLREEGGFVGEHEHDARLPLPEHISARQEDLQGLVQGMLDYDHDISEQLDAVMAAAVLAFGFVYIHPFEDGNGRLHRYLIHHVLALRGFNPAGVVFPVSAVILERIKDYKEVLQSYSKRLLRVIEWEPTEKMNVRVLNDTGDFYRYFDATPHVEFLYSCVEKTIDIDLPEEAEFLKQYDHFKGRVESLVEMPATTIDLLFNFLKQGGGRLSNRAKGGEFSALEPGEVEYVEKVYAEVFLE